MICYALHSWGLDQTWRFFLCCWPGCKCMQAAEEGAKLGPCGCHAFRLWLNDALMQKPAAAAFRPLSGCLLFHSFSQTCGGALKRMRRMRRSRRRRRRGSGGLVTASIKANTLFFFLNKKKGNWGSSSLIRCKFFSSRCFSSRARWNSFSSPSLPLPPTPPFFSSSFDVSRSTWWHK